MRTDFNIIEKGEMTDFVISIEKAGKRDDNSDWYKNYVGIVSVSKEFGPVEYGIAFVIDMSHKGKADQYTETFMQLTPFMEVDEFEQLCRDKEINIIYVKAKKF